MDTNASQQQQPVTDDQELAKVLSGMNNSNGGGLQFEETPSNAAPAPYLTDVTTDSPQTPTQPTEPPAAPVMPTPEATLPSPSPAQDAPEPAAASEHNQSSNLPSDLESIKKDALAELRPLVDRLDLPNDEKFDTLLLIIRSTDDQSLLSPAYEAAKSIEDDTRRAQALLDVIKEIDYFGAQK